jgi:polyphosphate kinase
MPRNLDRRVEVLFPVNDRKLIGHVKNEILDTYLADTVKARQMRSDGSYARRTARRGNAVNSQEAFIQNRKSVKR